MEKVLEKLKSFNELKDGWYGGGEGKAIKPGLVLMVLYCFGIIHFWALSKEKDEELDFGIFPTCGGNIDVTFYSKKNKELYFNFRGDTIEVLEVTCYGDDGYGSDETENEYTIDINNNIFNFLNSLEWFYKD